MSQFNGGYGLWDERPRTPYSIYPPPDDRSLQYGQGERSFDRLDGQIAEARAQAEPGRNSFRLASSNALLLGGGGMGGQKVADANASQAELMRSEEMSKEDLDEQKERGQWGSQLEFILACVGYAVGLGNVWRFPYLCYKNGGGAFLIPYAISLFLAGLPIFYLELILGQFSSLGPNCIFGKIAPITRGIGWGMVMVSTLVCVYYNMIIAWVLFYLGASFQSPLPWATCNLDYFYSERCFSKENLRLCKEEFGEQAMYYNMSCMNATDRIEGVTVKDLFNASQANLSSPAEEFFEKFMLNLSSGFEEMGAPEWRLVLANAGAWLIIFACLVKGVQSTGKVVYFTATFPYLILVILLIRGVTLDGADQGIKFYITPDWSRLADVVVWKDAAVQIFYSLGPAWGGLITMSSYNRFHNNCFRDAVIVALTNCGTSVFAGFAIFSVVGFMAKELGKEVNDVVRDGAGLAFIAYPEAIVRMPLPPLWAILFFFMLLTLGLDSQFAQLETVTTAIMDQFPVLRKRKSLVVLGACVVMFILGLPLCCPGGMYVFTLLNDYSAGYCLILIALAELVTVIHLYGIGNFTKDIQLMLGQSYNPVLKIVGSSGWYWRICWFAVTPLFLFGILICSFIFYSTSKYGSYVFGPSAEVAGWLISLVSVLCIPGFAAWAIFQNFRAGEPWRALFRPTAEWGPALGRKERVAAAEAVRRGRAAYSVASPHNVSLPTQPSAPDMPKY